MGSMPETMDPILTVDYSHWISGTEEQRHGFVENLMKSLDNTGFVKLINHGFSEQQLKEAFDWSRKFFKQPLEVKKEILSTTNPVRGYTVTGAETTSFLNVGAGESHETKDHKEHFDQGNKDDPDWPNKWPKSLPGFQTFYENYYEQCETVCLTLIKALEEGLGVYDGCITKRCVPSGTDLRLTHYNKIPLEEITTGRKIRIASHSDFGIITLLFQDGVGGLEVQDRSNPDLESFIPVRPTNDTEMVINLGATMQRWTNDKLFGGIHRVAMPEGLKGINGSSDIMIPGRTSIAYLFKAKKEVSVGPIAAFVDEKHPAKYPEMTGLEYHQWCNSRFYK
ncbi:MAG: hypothetical protein Q9218_002786 [Villophora microphyllina]